MIHAAVITPIHAPDATRLVKCLEIVEKLGLGSATIVYDRKGRSKAQAVAAASQFAGTTDVRLLEVDEIETALRWFPALLDGFARGEADRVLLFPGDIDSTGPDFVSNCARLLAASAPDGLTIGSYSCSDMFKETFDREVTLPILEKLYPDLTPLVRELDCTKLRSEITVVGKEFLQDFLRAYRWRWSCDPIIQMFLFGLERDKDRPPAERRVRSVSLQDFSDIKDTRSPVGRTYQILRLALALSEDRLRQVSRDHRNATDAEQRTLAAAAVDQVRAAVDKAMEAAKRDLDIAPAPGLIECHFFEAAPDNAKLSRADAKWRPFAGATILLDPPEADLTVERGIAVIQCRKESNPFYLSLVEAFTPYLPELVGRHAMTVLPFRSFHVTLADLVAEDGISQLEADSQASWHSYIHAIETQILDSPPSPDVPAVVPIPPVDFVFDKFSVFGSAVVARLRPARGAEEAMTEIRRIRSRLYESWASFGRPRAGGWNPHISLTYAPDAELAKGALPCLDAATRSVRSAMSDRSIGFQSARLFGFSRMDRFFRKP